MGLFANDSSASLEAGRKILEVAVRKFNDISGFAYSVSVDVDEDSLRTSCKTFDQIAGSDFPEVPGPFKRMAGLAILSQQLPLFRCHSVSSGGKSPLGEQGHFVWSPRMAVWCLPVFAEALSVNGDKDILQAFELPTPHFQVEFIALLRNFAFGAPEDGSLPEIPVLLERCVSVGLILEASAYASTDGTVRKGSLQSGANSCLEKIRQDPVLKDDMIFNDPEFLERAVGIGVD